jgi:hypothetical protein
MVALVTLALTILRLTLGMGLATQEPRLLAALDRAAAVDIVTVPPMYL